MQRTHEKFYTYRVKWEKWSNNLVRNIVRSFDENSTRLPLARTAVNSGLKLFGNSMTEGHGRLALNTCFSDVNGVKGVVELLAAFFSCTRV